MKTMETQTGILRLQNETSIAPIYRNHIMSIVIAVYHLHIKSAARRST